MSDSNRRFKRSIQKEIEDQIPHPEIIVITGMRRVGKTTLLRMLYDGIEDDNKVFFDLENMLDQEVFAEKDYNNIWSNLKEYRITRERRAYVFLDEIQAKPEVTLAVKYLYDHYNVKFFLSGSSSFYLRNLFPESLAGRKMIFELFPLDFREYLTFREIRRAFADTFPEKESTRNKISFEKYYGYFLEYCHYGGFPQVVLEDDEARKKRHLSDILSSFFEKDIRQLADFRNLTAIKELMLLLLPRVGSRLEITKLAAELRVTRETVYSYMAFLEGAYFLKRISPFSKNIDREVSGTRKVYFCDNGLLNLFGKVSDGALLENAVFLNLRKYGEISYYQRRSGKEIDFVQPAIELCFEVKRKGTAGDVKNLEKLSLSIGIKSSYVVSQLYNEVPGLILAQDI